MRSQILGMLLIIATLVGCNRGNTETVVPDSPSAKDDLTTIEEVFETHDVQPADLRYSLEEVEEKISKTGEWTPVKLEEVGVGKYEATAFTRDNREFQMEVRQTSGGIYWRWKNEDESSGGSAMNTW